LLALGSLRAIQCLALRATSFAAITCAVLVTATPSAHAQGNYRSTPLGGRSALMGNTGVALASDGSAPYLNPATIVRIDDSTLAFSVNVYSYSLAHYTGWHAPGAVDANRFGQLGLADTNENQGRFDVIPSTLCLFFTLKGWGHVLGEDREHEGGSPGMKGRQKLAACLGTTERETLSFPAINYRSLTPGATASQAQSFTRSWGRFHVGPTWSFYATDDLAFGFSLHGIFSTYDVFRSSSNATVDGAGQAIVSSVSSTADGRSLDLAAILGMTYHLSRGTTFGLSVQTPALHVLGTYDANIFNAYSGAGDHAYLALGHGTFAAPPPFRIAAGLGSESRSLKLEADVSYYAPMGAAIHSDLHSDTTAVASGIALMRSQDLSLTESAGSILDSAVGFEYFLIPSFSILGGLSTDFSAAPSPPPSTATSFGIFTEERMHKVDVSMGIGSYGQASDLLAGVQLGYGWGTALAVNGFVLPNDLSVVDKRSYSIVLVVAGNASLRAIEQTLQRVEHLVTKGRGN
jgi:hypothetical protein